MKYWRATAISHTINILHTTPALARVTFKSSLGLGAIIIHLLNTLTIPNKPSQPLRGLLRAAAYQYIQDATSAAEVQYGWAVGSAVPALRHRGLYFLAGIAENDIGSERSTWRIAGVENVGTSMIQLTDKAIAVMYGQASFADIYRAFGLSAPKSNADNPTLPIIDRIPHGNRTIAAFYTWKRPDPPSINFGLALANISIAPSFVLQGTDIPYPRVERDGPAETLINSNDITKVLNNIFLQIAHDIIARAPNRKRNGTYCTLTPSERKTVPPQLYQQATIPFDCAHIRRVTEDSWNRICEHFLPTRGYAPKLKTRAFPQCSYYIAWAALLNRLTPSDADFVRAQMMAKLQEFKWLPYAEPGGMWISCSMPIEPGGALTLPEGWTEAAPVLAANSWSFRTKSSLARFKLRLHF